MSLADLWRRRPTASRWKGLRPPPATPAEIARDLRWHAALYREDGLPWRVRAVFLLLRVVQRLAYNLGWSIGGRS